MIVLALAFFVALSLTPAANAAASPGAWQRPVGGPVSRAFSLTADRFARGQHRGVDLAAAHGSEVRAACGGRVSFAGSVPGGGRTVSVRCGRLIATSQQLGSIAVGRGAVVLAGAQLGTVGRSQDRRSRRSHVHLGARIAATGRYVDPMALIGEAPPALPALPPGARGARDRAPLGPAPAPRRVVRPLAQPVMRPLARPVMRSDPRLEPKASAPAASLPWAVWAGLACVGLALPLGGLVRIRHGRRRRDRSAAVAVRAT